MTWQECVGCCCILFGAPDESDKGSINSAVPIIRYVQINGTQEPVYSCDEDRIQAWMNDFDRQAQEFHEIPERITQPWTPLLPPK
ncbi:hypothetical protein A3J41_02415 [candidate division TM6 bacterium RIFCSPHIGHO2_12_FULL_38_8]|nr:MAG: hypothetical protein A3J41_02415 [candidate division TM6 bacterium RIFCSPHIGHO2_12_FULL_38_8]